MKIELLSPGEEHYENVNQAMRDQMAKRVDYEILSQRYNGAKMRDVLLLNVSENLKISNVVKALHSRGLVRDLDYIILRIKTDIRKRPIPAGQRPLAIKKQSQAVLSAKPI